MTDENASRKDTSSPRKFGNKLSANFSFESDLNGAIFEGTDLRGADFSKLSLEDAQFLNCKAGLSTHTKIIKTLLLFVAIILSGFPMALGFWWITYLWLSIPSNIDVKYAPGYIICALFSVIVIYPLFDRNALRSFGINTAVAAIAVALSGFIGIIYSVPQNSLSVAIPAIASIVGHACFIGGSLVVVALYYMDWKKGFLVAFILIASIVNALIVAWCAHVVDQSSATKAAEAIFNNNKDLLAMRLTALGGVISLTVSYLLASKRLHDSPDYNVLNRFSLEWIAIKGGTKFCGAKLSRANFNGTSLRLTDFRNLYISSLQKKDEINIKVTELYHASWKNAKDINFALFDKESVLSDKDCRDLLITRDGRESNFTLKNLSKTNLQGAQFYNAILERTNLDGSILENANLHKANLKQANLNRTKLEGADLTEVDLSQTLLGEAILVGAKLTGANITDWVINSSTNLYNVECKYVNIRGLRKPGPKMEFKEGEFEAFIKPLQSIIEFLHSNHFHTGCFQGLLEQLRKQYPSESLMLIRLEMTSNGRLKSSWKTNDTSEKSISEKIESIQTAEYITINHYHAPVYIDSPMKIHNSINNSNGIQLIQSESATNISQNNQFVFDANEAACLLSKILMEIQNATHLASEFKKTKDEEIKSLQSKLDSDKSDSEVKNSIRQILNFIKEVESTCGSLTNISDYVTKLKDIVMYALCYL